MRPFRKAYSSFIMIFVCLLIIPGVVYAWIVQLEGPPVAEFRIGEVNVQTSLSSEWQETGIELPNLSYVDFNTDIIADSTETLNLVSTQVIIEIEALAETIPIRNVIEIAFPELQDELIYLIIIEGINPGEIHENLTDYHTFLKGLVPEGNTDIAYWRNAINQYNQSVLADLAEIVMIEGDILRIQIVFWGDYASLSDTTDYLNAEYLVTLNIMSVQSDKGE